MKTALFAAAAMIAVPAMAQTTPSSTPMPQDQSAMPASSSPTPTMTPDQSTMAQGQSTMAQGQSTTSAPMSTSGGMAGSGMNTPNASPAGAPVTTNADGQMSMMGDKLPWCRPGQYNACREHENAKGQGMHRSSHKMGKMTKGTSSTTSTTSGQ